MVCCDERGLARFDVLRHRRNEANAFLYAFDLLELNGADLRREPIEVRKATLASILRKARHGVRLNEHLEHNCGLTVFQHACKMGLEGIVSKRLGSRYRRAVRPMAQVQEPGGAGGEAGGGGGLGSLINMVAFKAPSQSRSGSRSPAFASSMIFWATASRVGATGPSACWSVTRAISKATPRRRAVSDQPLGLASSA